MKGPSGTGHDTIPAPGLSGGGIAVTSPFAMEQILSVNGDREAYFWATHGGAELDLLVFLEGKRIGFEFKYSEKPGTSKSMRIAEADLKLDHLYVVHPGKHTFPLTEKITASTLPDVINIF